MLGPAGCGILVVKKSRRELLRPAIIGGWNVVSPNFIAQRDVQFETGGRKFEPGAYTHTVLTGLRAAVELLLEVGANEVWNQNRSSTHSLREQINAAGFEFLSPTEEKNRSGILTFRHSQIAGERFLDGLTKNDIVVSLRFDRTNRVWLRISPHSYNNEAQITKIAKLLIQQL